MKTLTSKRSGISPISLRAPETDSVAGGFGGAVCDDLIVGAAVGATMKAVEYCTSSATRRAQMRTNCVEMGNNFKETILETWAFGIAASTSACATLQGHAQLVYNKLQQAGTTVAQACGAIPP